MNKNHQETETCKIVMTDRDSYQVTTFHHAPKLSPYIKILFKWSKNKFFILLESEAEKVQMAQIVTRQLLVLKGYKCALEKITHPRQGKLFFFITNKAN